MEVAVKNINGDTVDTVNLDDAVFSVPMNHSLVHQALVIYQSNKRHGTHDTKTRAQVSGGGRKPWIQKHTGRARQGSIRAPQWRHGGVVFGPHPRSYRKALPKRLRRQAVQCVLSAKARGGNLVCVDSMDTLDGRTKSMISLLRNLGISSSALVVTSESDANVVRAAHNIKGVWTLPLNLLNANDLLRRETLIMTVEAAQQAQEFWNAPINRGNRRPNAAGAEPVEPSDEETPTPGQESAPAAESPES
jgi:large subunit ribosomal protein L4